MPMIKIPKHIAQAADQVADFFAEHHVEKWQVGRVQSTSPAPLDELPDLESDQGELDRLSLVKPTQLG